MNFFNGGRTDYVKLSGFRWAFAFLYLVVLRTLFEHEEYLQIARLVENRMSFKLNSSNFLSTTLIWEARLLETLGVCLWRANS